MKTFLPSVSLQPDVLIKKRKLDSNVRSEFEVNLSKIKEHLDEMEALVNSDVKIVALEQSHIERKPLFDQLLVFGQEIIADGINGHLLHIYTFILLKSVCFVEMKWYRVS